MDASRHIAKFPSSAKTAWPQVVLTVPKAPPHHRHDHPLQEAEEENPYAPKYPAISEFPMHTVAPLQLPVKSLVSSHLPEPELPAAHEHALGVKSPPYAKKERNDPENQTQCHQPTKHARLLSFDGLNLFLFEQANIEIVSGAIGIHDNDKYSMQAW